MKKTQTVKLVENTFKSRVVSSKKSLREGGYIIWTLHM